MQPTTDAPFTPPSTPPEYQIECRPPHSFAVIRKVNGLSYFCASFYRPNLADARDLATKHAAWHNRQQAELARGDWHV